MAIWRMRFACWVPKDTNTLSEYAIRIAFPRQQRLRERASVLHCMYNAYVAITETVCVYCAVQPQSLYITGFMQKNVSWLKRAMVGMSPRRSGLDPRPVRVRLVVVKVTPGQLFLHMLRCFPLVVYTSPSDYNCETDKQTKPGNLQTKPCYFGYRGALNRK
jgi:hypothetical protein